MLKSSFGNDITFNSRGRFRQFKYKRIKLTAEVKLFICIAHNKSSISFDEAFDVADSDSDDNLIAHITILNNVIELIGIFEINYCISDELRAFVVRTDEKRKQFIRTRWKSEFIPEFAKSLIARNQIDQLIKIHNKFDKLGLQNLLLHYYNTVYKIYKASLANKNSSILWHRLKDICRTTFYIFSLSLNFIFKDYLLQSMLGHRSKEQKKKVMFEFDKYLSAVINRELQKIKTTSLNSRRDFDQFLIKIWKLDFNNVAKIKKNGNFKHKLYSIRFSIFEDFAAHEDYPKKHSRYKLIKELVLLAASRIDNNLYEEFEIYFKSNRGFKLY